MHNESEARPRVSRRFPSPVPTVAKGLTVLVLAAGLHAAGVRPVWADQSTPDAAQLPSQPDVVQLPSPIQKVIDRVGAAVSRTVYLQRGRFNKDGKIIDTCTVFKVTHERAFNNGHLSDNYDVVPAYTDFRGCIPQKNK